MAVGYGPRCVPVMQLAEAAAGLCDLLWMIDTSVPGMGEMADLLNRFGTVVDLEGMSTEQAVKTLADWEPDGLTTYLDAGMVELALCGRGFGPALPQPGDRRRPHRQGPPAPGPGRRPASTCPLATSSAPTSPRASSWPSRPRWGGPPSSNPARPRAAATPSWPATVPSSTNLLDALGPGRPDMVLEGYLPDDPARDGDPYAGYVSVESVVADGVISHLALTGRFPPAENFRETGFFIPAALDAGSRSAVLDLATRAIDALGVRTGCLHTEVKFTPDGPRIIEVNGRVGGGVPEMLERAAGVSLLDLTLRVALGESVFVDGPVATDRIGYRFFLQPPTVSATVTAIEGINDFSDHAEVDTVSLHQGPGAALDWRDGSGNHIVAVVGSTDDEEQLQAAYRLLHQEVTVTYTDVRH